MQNLLGYHHMIDPMYAQIEDERKEIVWHPGNPTSGAIRGILVALLLSVPIWLAIAFIAHALWEVL